MFLFQDLKEHDFVVTFLKKKPTFFRTLSSVRWLKFGRLIFLLKKVLFVLHFRLQTICSCVCLASKKLIIVYNYITTMGGNGKWEVVKCGRNGNFTSYYQNYTIIISINKYLLPLL